jgi:hypothetical protein
MLRETGIKKAQIFKGIYLCDGHANNECECECGSSLERRINKQIGTT